MSSEKATDDEKKRIYFYQQFIRWVTDYQQRTPTIDAADVATAAASLYLEACDQLAMDPLELLSRIIDGHAKHHRVRDAN